MPKTLKPKVDYIMRNGVASAVILPVQEYEELLEDLHDRDALTLQTELLEQLAQRIRQAVRNIKTLFASPGRALEETERKQALAS